jgi:hypothetical protein
MPYALRTLRRHAVVALVVLSAFLTAPAIAGEIFKCVAKDGGPLYQNFPCYLDSIGSSPSNPSVAKTASMPGAAGQEKPKAQPVNVASTVKSAYTGELNIGMTEDEVRALLGEPEERVDDEPAEGGRVSLWRYADGRSVQFDHKHYVMEIQQR